MSDWENQRLARTHDHSGFDCGQPALNAWLKERAGQFDRKDLSRTYVATHSGAQAVLGYYALSTHRVVSNLLPPEESKGLPRLDLPVVLLGRLAVGRNIQRQGLGEFLLVDALRRTVRISEQIGVRAVEVDAIDEDAKRFYLKFGFRPLLDDARHLFIPVHEIRKMASE